MIAPERRDEATISAMIQAYVNCGLFWEALELFEESVSAPNAACDDLTLLSLQKALDGLWRNAGNKSKVKRWVQTHLPKKAARRVLESLIE